MALVLVKTFPGSTVKELVERRASLWGPEGSDYEQVRQRIGRRMSELAKKGWIHALGKRNGCQLWWPGPEPEAAKQGALFEIPAKWETD